MTPEMTVAWDDGLQQHEQRAPSLDRIRRLVARLDGRSRTLVTLYRGERHMAVGGDVDRGLVAYVATENGGFQQLVTGSPATGVAEIVAGGQPGNYTDDAVVESGLALRAVSAFFASGDPDPTLAWRSS